MSGLAGSSLGGLARNVAQSSLARLARGSAARNSWSDSTRVFASFSVDRRLWCSGFGSAATDGSAFFSASLSATHSRKRFVSVSVSPTEML